MHLESCSSASQAQQLPSSLTVSAPFLGTSFRIPHAPGSHTQTMTALNRETNSCKYVFPDMADLHS